MRYKLCDVVFLINIKAHCKIFNFDMELALGDIKMEHLAVMRQPLYNMVLSGEKTIESRWTLNKCAPYNKIAIGDKIWFKEVGKPITAKAEVEKVKFFELTPELADKIKIEFGDKIGTSKFENWENYKQKKFLTLIWLKNVTKVTPIKINKKSRTAWVVLTKSITEYSI